MLEFLSFLIFAAGFRAMADTTESFWGKIGLYLLTFFFLSAAAATVLKEFRK